jgi:glucose dehydrogenase
MHGRTPTKRLLPSVGAALLLGTALPAVANDSVLQETANPKQWAMQQGDYANTRYSTLDQITKDNVGDLQVA